MHEAVDEMARAENVPRLPAGDGWDFLVEAIAATTTASAHQARPDRSW